MNISLNGKKLNIKSFDKYCSLYLEKDEKYIYEKINDRWEIVISISKTDKRTNKAEIVIPETPIESNADLTSSNLNGLIIADTNFILYSV